MKNCSVMRLATIGSNCIDLYENIDGSQAFPGGGPVNMGVYAKRLGIESSYIGAVGSDSNGNALIKGLRDHGVDTSHVHVLEGKTAVTQVRLVQGERVFGDYDEGVLEHYFLSSSDFDFISRNHDIVVSDLWGKMENSFKEFQRRGIKTAFDCATRPSDKECLVAIPHTDYLFFSSDDGDTRTLREFMQLLFQLGPSLVVALLGKEGSLCFDGSQFYQFGIVPCSHCIDTMGAGDSYITGFLYGVYMGLPIEECMKQGATLASQTLQYFGAW